MPLEFLQDTDSSHTTIAPHQSSYYPDYLSPTWDKDTQQAVVWTRLRERRKLANCSLSKINKRFLALRQEQQTQVESSHKPLSRDIIDGHKCTHRALESALVAISGLANASQASRSDLYHHLALVHTCFHPNGLSSGNTCHDTTDRGLTRLESSLG